MANAIKIQVTDKARATLRHLQTLPQWGLKAVAKGMQLNNALTVSYIQKTYLTGKGPFPVATHRLGFRSQALRSRLWASEPTVSGQVVTSAIGDNVVYAAIHEFGGRIVRKAHTRTLRFKTRAGALVKQKTNKNLRVFAKRTDANAHTESVRVGEYTIDMPERAPVRTGIQDRLQDYGRLISRELLAAWGENK